MRLETRHIDRILSLISGESLGNTAFQRVSKYWLLALNLIRSGVREEEDVASCNMTSRVVFVRTNSVYVAELQMIGYRTEQFSSETSLIAIAKLQQNRCLRLKCILSGRHFEGPP